MKSKRHMVSLGLLIMSMRHEPHQPDVVAVVDPNSPKPLKLVGPFLSVAYSEPSKHPGRAFPRTAGPTIPN